MTPAALEAADFQVLRDSAPVPLTGNLLSAGSPSHGSAEVRDGTLHYTPEPGFSGADSLAVTRRDGSRETVRIDVRPHPNFVFILTDDQSWTSLSARMDRNNPSSRSDLHRTPHIDSLVADGMRFSRGYSPAPNCSPSRYANLTGKTCARLKFTDIVDRGHTKGSIGQLLIPINKATRAIQEKEATLPELLKSLPRAGYTTAHFGKWHLAGGGPERHGFDASDGPTGNREGSQGPTVKQDAKLAYGIAQRGNEFITAAVAAGTPFYCQLSHYAVHAKIQYRKDTFAETKTWAPGKNHASKRYAAMLADLDRSVGHTLAHLDRLGLRHSTYVVYQADNGAPKFLSNAYPLKRYKPEIWEGGTRVPTLFRGPGIPAGSQCDQAMMGIDFLPTLWELAGGTPGRLPADLDGASLTGWLRGRTDLPLARPGELVIHSPHYILTTKGVQAGWKDQRPSSVLHDGPWKLVAWFETGALHLFHLEDDPGETRDLSTEHPAEKLRLWKRLRDYLAEVGAQLPTLDPAHPSHPGGVEDADADGLPDAWEFSQLLTHALGPADDPDGDGLDNAREHKDGTDPLTANKAAPPHIVVYLSDDHSQCDSSLYGAPDIPTPNLEALAREGMTFTHAFVASPSCAPSRAALLTALMPARNGAEGNHTYPREGVHSLVSDLKQAGYRVASFGKIAHGPPKQWKRYRFDFVSPTKNHDQLKQEVRRFLERQPQGQPVCLFIGTTNPHVSWPLDNTVDPSGLRLPPHHLDTPETRRLRAAYVQEIIDLDTLLGELRGLTRRQLGDEVIFLHTSDHGSQWPFGKWNLYDYGTRVPLVLSWPGKVEAGSRSDAMVSWVDLLPTLVEAAGGTLPPELDGTSFLPVLLGTSPTHRNRIFTTHSGDTNRNIFPIRSVRTREWKLIHNLHPEYAHTNHSDLLRKEGTATYWADWVRLADRDERARAIVDRYYRRPEFELYHVSEDRWETNNLIEAPEQAERVARLKKELADWMESQGDTGRIFSGPRPLDRPGTWHPDHFPDFAHPD